MIRFLRGSDEHLLNSKGEATDRFCLTEESDGNSNGNDGCTRTGTGGFGFQQGGTEPGGRQRRRSSAEPGPARALGFGGEQQRGVRG